MNAAISTVTCDFIDRPSGSTMRNVALKKSGAQRRRSRVSFDEDRDTRVAGTSQSAPLRPTPTIREVLDDLEATWADDMPLAQRKQTLRTYAEMRFRRRFQMPWLERWNDLTNKVARRVAGRRGRSLNDRGALVALLDRDEVLRWPVADYDLEKKCTVPLRSEEQIARLVAIGVVEQREPPYGDLSLRRRPPTELGVSSRFLSLNEYVWISLLVGNWSFGKGPRDVLRAERSAMKQALRRYGAKPFVTLNASNDGSLDISSPRRHPVQRGKRKLTRPP